MTGRVFVVTGANCGIGFEAAKYLIEGGNEVVLACRNEQKAKEAIESIKRDNPRGKAVFLQLDITDVESIQKFVFSFKSQFSHLNGLINNAGMAQSFDEKDVVRCKNGYEITMMTNYIGHALLTLLLIDLLKEGVKSCQLGRIVNVSSTLHNIDENPRMMKDIKPLDVNNFFLDNPASDFNGLQAYKNSKLCQILFTYKLAEDLKGSGILINAACPGFIPTTNFTRSSSRLSRCFLVCCFHYCLRPLDITRTPNHGGRLIADLAFHQRFNECNGSFVRDYFKDTSSSETHDENLRQKVWDLTMDLLRRAGASLPAPSSPAAASSEASPAAFLPAEKNSDAVAILEVE